MATFTDDFTAPDGTTLASLGFTVGQFVVGTPSPTATVQNNRAQIEGYTPYALRTVAAGDIDLTVTLVSGAGTQPAIFPRYVDTDNYFYWRADGVVRTRLGGVNNETTSLVGWTSGDTVRVSIVGTTVTFWVNGAGAGSHQLTQLATSTLAGIGGASVSSSVVFNNLSISDSTPAPPSLPIQDTFDRADSSTLGTTSDGKATWENIKGAVTWQISSNRTSTGSGVDTNGIVAVVDSGITDHSVEAQIAVSPSTGGNLALAFRVQDASNMSLLFFFADKTVAAYDFINGAYTQRTITGTASNWAVGDVFKVALNGTTATVIRNGAAYGSFATDRTGTKTGIWSANNSSNTGSFDNFNVAPAVAPNDFGDYAPTGLAATTDRVGEILVTWDGEDGVEGETGYELFRDGVSIYEGITSEYLDDGLGDDVSHTYTVRSFRVEG